MTVVNIRLLCVLFCFFFSFFLQRDKCPQFENLQPSLIPVGFKTPITFEGKNLEKYMVKPFIDSFLM